MMELCATILDDVGYSHEFVASLKFNKESLQKRLYLLLQERLQRIFTKSDILQEEGTLRGAQAWILQHISLSENQEIIEHYTRAQFQQLHLDQDPVSSQNLDEVEDEDDQDGYGSEVEVLDYQDYVGESDDEDILKDARSYLITLQITRELDIGDYTRAY